MAVVICNAGSGSIKFSLMGEAREHAMTAARMIPSAGFRLIFAYQAHIRVRINDEEGAFS